MSFDTDSNSISGRAIGLDSSSILTQSLDIRSGCWSVCASPTTFCLVVRFGHGPDNDTELILDRTWSSNPEALSSDLDLTLRRYLSIDVLLSRPVRTTDLIGFDRIHSLTYQNRVYRYPTLKQFEGKYKCHLIFVIQRMLTLPYWIRFL